MNSTEALYPISKVCQLTGINPVTLRSWERRHDLINPIRSSSGKRFYSKSNINQIKHILSLLDDDIPIGQVRNVLTGINTNQKTDQDSVWHKFFDQMINATQQFDENQLLEIYNEALSLFTIDQVIDKLIVPVLHTLGQRWSEGEALVAEEHFFQLFFRNKIGARFHHQQNRKYKHKIVTACISTEQHELGLLLFSLYARENNVDVVMLGVDTPLNELPEVCRRAKCSAIVLSGGCGVDFKAILPELKRLIKLTKVPVFIGGRLSSSDENRLKKINITPAGSNIQLGLAIINAKLRKK